ncbi:hypothetical protein ACFQMA_23155 [Halosimplex aquaticum]|uniref:Uncharacterized protein n=1 Tax=Halosimplex aquaticum TaxID=3026162 RepID=A0ABD5YBK7_9EURY|nr:hypothetical protein [Halosimplex aquaticum]
MSEHCPDCGRFVEFLGVRHGVKTYRCSNCPRLLPADEVEDD